MIGWIIVDSEYIVWIRLTWAFEREIEWFHDHVAFVNGYAQNPLGVMFGFETPHDHEY